MNDKVRIILDEVGKVIRGKDKTIEMAMTAILAKGHILIEDVPGVGKTTLAVAFSRAMELTERRLQFTPDVLPSDVVGFNMIGADGEFQYKPGAILCDLLLADAGLSQADWTEKKPHLSAALCGALAREARAGALLLTHLNPLYDPASLLAEAREAYPAAELARLGERYRV